MNQEIRKQIVREGLTTLSEFNSPVLWKLYAQDSQLNSLSKKKKKGKITNDIANLLPVER